MRLSLVTTSVLAALAVGTTPASGAAVERRHPVPPATLVQMTVSFVDLSAHVHDAANSQFATECLAHSERRRMVGGSRPTKRDWLDDVLKVVAALEPLIVPLISCNTTNAPTIGALIGHTQAALLRSDLTKLQSAVDKCAPGSMPAGGCASLVDWVGPGSGINCTTVASAFNSMMAEMRGLPLIGRYFE